MTPPTGTEKRISSRPSEVNKLFTSLVFAALLSTAAFLLFASSTARSAIRAPAFLTLGAFLLSFLFTTVFQVIKCPFNAVTVSIASAAVSGTILFFVTLLSIPLVGPFLQGIVSAASPYVETDQLPTGDPAIYYTNEEKHNYSRAYAYWMFWGGILPMYTILGFIRSC